MEILGWVGTALVIIAYFPQIRHLFFERCAWGISVSTWLIWLMASLVLSLYCILRSEFLLFLAQGVNVAAILVTIVLVRSSNRVCPFHSDPVIAQGENALCREIENGAADLGNRDHEGEGEADYIENRESRGRAGRMHIARK